MEQCKQEKSGHGYTNSLPPKQGGIGFGTWLTCQKLWWHFPLLMVCHGSTGFPSTKTGIEPKI